MGRIDVSGMEGPMAEMIGMPRMRLEKNGILRLMLAALITCLVISNCSINTISFNGIIKDTDSYSIWWTLSGNRILTNTVPLKAHSEGIEIHLAKNEVESFQLVVAPKKDMTANPIKLPEKDGLEFFCNSVGFINIGASSVPDILYDCKTTALKKGENSIFWITVKTLPETKSGDYEAYLELNDEKISIKVHVFDFALPAKSSIKTVGRVWWSDKLNKKIELVNMYKNLIEHRVFNGGYVIPPPKVAFDMENSKVKIDFRGFDRMAEYLLAKLNYDAFFVPFFFGGWGGLANDKWLDEIPVESKEFEKYYGEYLTQLAAHLKDKGWLDRTYIQPWDEPQDRDMDKVIKILKIIRNNAPGLKIYLTTWSQKELYGLVDIWTVPLYRESFNHKEIKKRQALGEEVWGYQNTHFNYTSNPLNMRLLPWLVKKYGLQGIEWWSVSRWPDVFGFNPDFRPGDGILLYQPVDNSRKPLNSIRWELYRDGLEDSEYIAFLEKKIGKEKTDKMINQLVKGINTDARVVDPYSFERLRIKMGREIEKLYDANRN